MILFLGGDFENICGMSPNWRESRLDGLSFARCER